MTEEQDRAAEAKYKDEIVHHWKEQDGHLTYSLTGGQAFILSGGRRAPNHPA